MSERPNVVYLFADQLRATSLPIYGEEQISTPHLDRLAADGVIFDNMVSTCPVCTPYRSMLVTGRHPQTTGHLVNFICTRHDEISIGDAFRHAGYRTGWIGKWHLHRGSFPQVEGQDYVPEGRDRLGFDYWRGYNFHSQYYQGWVNKGDWRNERWEGYETDALNRYAFEFLDEPSDQPFLLFVSPHQPHFTTRGPFAPDEYYDRLPDELIVPENVPDEIREQSVEMYRHYLAMTLALDDMLGELYQHLEQNGQAENTIFVYSSDHGTQVGAQGIDPWQKMRPYDESLRVPMVARWPGHLDGGRRCDTLTAPVDLFPTLCTLCGVPIPRTVEGIDLSQSWLGEDGACEQDAVLTMNFTATYDWMLDGAEWRGLRTKRSIYTRWLSGLTELFDLETDPLQMFNLAGDPRANEIETRLAARLDELMAARNDTIEPCHTLASWFDHERRVVQNAYGPLSDPESTPDWSLLS